MEIVICIPNSDSHYVNSDIAFMSTYNTFSEEFKHYPIDLVDIDNVTLPKSFIGTSIVFNKRLYDRCYGENYSCDLDTECWLKNISLDKSYLSFTNFKNFYKRTDYLRYIPFNILKSSCERFIKHFLKEYEGNSVSTDTEFYRKYVFPNIETIERNGLCVNLDNFNNNFNKKYVTNIVRSYYNIHTSTGRPSNTFDNINFSALSKKDSSRESFISRFDNGYLVEYDFDSYHLRLIGKMIGYDFDNWDSIHTEFAKLYFSKNDISEDEYTESKKISFTMLYKDIEDPKYNIDFFDKVNSFKEKIWQKYLEKSYIVSPISKRKLVVNDTCNKSKFFSYYIQMIETEFSMLFIYDINYLLKDKKSKVILYTYDSILIDYNPLDGDKLLSDIKGKLIKSKVSLGKNYKEMRRVSIN
jgi:hypothetical protein